ncbi:DCN1-like protein 4 isoform X1 [Brassica rapa]|uniref:DCN1-like protein 4 isoform X1 n=1 Tax=Brassica campestris TaxID=3711 RepID=UPI00142E20A6|nr:DCN1-like protein 4 isoform X1 [Brassica rapa]
MKFKNGNNSSGHSSPRQLDGAGQTDVGFNHIFHHGSVSSRAVDEQDLEGIVDVFHRYSNTASNLIDPQGIELLCSDLDVSRTDIRILMLAWKMKAEKQGYFTQEEWTRGLMALRADTIDKLKKALPALEKEVRRPSNFADFYAYAFTYSLTEEEQKSVDIETICQLLDIVMGSTFRPQVDYFLDYLKIQNDYKVIYMDQWMGFYRFCNEISFPDMSEYNPGLAWPLLLNNFVEWIREKQA